MTGILTIWNDIGRRYEAVAEMRSRGRDQLMAGALLVECVRRSDAERVAKSLEAPPAALGISGPGALGVYALLCIHEAAADSGRLSV